MSEQRNLILALVLSMGVLFVWYAIFPPVQPDAATQNAQNPAIESTISANEILVSRDEALAKSSRVQIETDKLIGSINLVGGRLDDLSLKNFNQTNEAGSEIVRMLSPRGSAKAVYVDHLWQKNKGSAAKVPQPNSVWTVSSANQVLGINNPVTLSFDNGEGQIFSMTYEVDENYMFTVKQSIENKGVSELSLIPTATLRRHGEPDDLINFFVIHEGFAGYLGDASLEEVSYGGMRDEGRATYAVEKGGWLGFADNYWANLLIPDQEIKYTGVYDYNASGEGQYTVLYNSENITVPVGGTVERTSRLYSGAKVASVISAYEEDLQIQRLDLSINWGMFHFLTRPFHWALVELQALSGNFGIAILLLTVIVKLIFFPLANKSYQSMANMRRVQPQMKELQEKYKDDRQKLQQEMMGLYKKEKVNPLSGCWPVLIQIPVFFALYKVLLISIEMRHAPFFGWVTDLSAPDPTSIFNLFGLLPYDVPAWLPFLGIWPILMGISMFIQMRLNPTPPDKTQAMIFGLMPIVFTFLLASFPVGLVIYWAWNNTLTILQQYTIMRRSGVEVNLLGNISEALFFWRKKDS